MMSAMTMKSSGAGGSFKIEIGAILLIMLVVLQVDLLLLVSAEKAAAPCIDSERRALLHFKAALVDGYGMLSSWGSDEEDHNPNCCQWKGVTCNHLTGHVQRLDLHGRHDDERWSYLSGQIHTSLIELQQLRYLNLSWNYFRDMHIPEFFGSMGNLRYLDLSFCFFVGKIPSQFGSLSHLKYLNLGQNMLEGSIPYQLGNLSKLQYLNLNENDFRDSHIPQFLGSMSNLRYLDLSSCRFGGKIPSRFGTLSHLKYLDLSLNSLEGSIPYQLGNLSKLLYLDLSYNNFDGTIPSQLGNLSSLHTLYLKSNIDDGALKIDGGSWWLSTLTSLTQLDLSGVLNLNTSHNWLQMIGKLPKLRELILADCSFSDHFIISLYPFKFNFSTSLSVLDLTQNTFTSPLVFQWVSNVSFNLVELDLSGNLLEGDGSSHFGSVMDSLVWLDLSGNRLKGKDLKSFINICTLHSLHLGRNNLTEDLSSIVHNFSIGCARHSLQELDLSQNKIIGTLSDLSIFTSLKTLDLSGNRLSGKLLESSKLPPKLKSLSIRSNSLEGGIPTSFGNTCTLDSLDLSNNRLSEELPMIIRQLSGCARYSLKELLLGMNGINDTLPDLSMFSALKTLDLSENQLNGKIPEEIRLPTQLESLTIQSNSLKGGIPKSFGKTCTLSSLDFSNNSLSGELQMIIHNLSGCARYSLEQVLLGMNQIQGTLPDFSMFPSLKDLSLFENKLNGKIAEDIFPSLLDTLDISSNCLEGVITESHFANMSMLRVLDLSDNQVTLVFSQNWIPPFQLQHIGLRSCWLGPHFPKWLQTQNNFYFLDISNAGIANTVPEWFWAKLGLQQFANTNISYNILKGTIPNLPLRNSDYYLSLASNQFEGPIPSFLRGAITLDLSKNKFSDSYSFVCTNGTSESLGQIDLSNNQLSGQIPDCWSHFKYLAYLDLSHNKFSGVIPSSLGSLFELQALILRNNSLSEEIPLSMKNCTKLVMLDVRENKLSGHIPSWIGSRLQELQFLSLQRNNFFGNLPLQICYLKSIRVMDISLNNLSGQVPKCIKNLTSMARKTSSSESFGSFFFVHGRFLSLGGSIYLNALLMWKDAERLFKNNELSLLKSIDLSSNKLSGEIPTEIGNLLELVSLNLSRNNLTGEIPSNIGRLTSLEFIDLSRNQLSGSIPSSLAQIDRLTILDVSHNHLSGRIPTGTQLQSFDASRYEDNLGLCGKPLDKLCFEGEPPREPTVIFDQDEHLTFAHAFYMSMALGFAVGFWGIFGSILVKRSWRHAYFRFLNNLTNNIYVIIAVKVVKYKRWLKS